MGPSSELWGSEVDSPPGGAGAEVVASMTEVGTESCICRLSHPSV